MVSITLEKLWMFSDRIVDFQFFVNPNQAKVYQDLIKMVCITLEKLWMISDKIIDFQCFVTGPNLQ